MGNTANCLNSGWRTAVINKNNEPMLPCGMVMFPQKKHMVLVMHNESTFYANDHRKTQWIHNSERPEPVHKGEGSSLLVSEMLS